MHMSLIRKSLLVVMVVLFLGLGTIAGVLLFVSRSLAPTPESPELKRVAFPPGTGVPQLAEELEKQGLIRDASVFTLYLKLKGEGGKFQAGEYAMSPGISKETIVGMLNRGETFKEASLRVTVPEGFTLRQIAEKLQQQGIDGQAFIQAAQSYKAPAESAAAGIPASAPLKERLEGYLFPETYEWPKDVTAEEVVKTMTGELDKKLAQLPADWEQAAAKHGLTLHQVLTLASLVEREVAVDEERALVSGVIHNRLKQNKQLEIDATVQYLFEKQKERLFEKDLRIESPYNTYLNKGLPPGPIASPSLDSIKAALYPAETKYLFYVTKKDGSRSHLFAETFEQHKKNIAESNKMSPAQ